MKTFSFFKKKHLFRYIVFFPKVRILTAVGTHSTSNWLPLLFVKVIFPKKIIFHFQRYQAWYIFEKFYYLTGFLRQLSYNFWMKSFQIIFSDNLPGQVAIKPDENATKHLRGDSKT